MARRAKQVLSRRFLPQDPRAVGPYRLTPALAVRIGVLGMLALLVFAVLFLRLWALQVLSGTQYLRAAQNNQLRTVRKQAPRGPILDRYGHVLVRVRAGTDVQLWPSDLPHVRTERIHELRALARVVGVPLSQIGRAIRKHRDDPVTPVTVKTGMSQAVVGYLQERQEDFPGVKIGTTYPRAYPWGSLAAQVLGYVSEISPDQLKALKKQGYRAGDTIGQAGIENTYDRYLRGTPGVLTRIVDSLGLTDRVIFSGRIDDADLPALYSDAAVYVTPSLEEGFGATVLEAMACAAPVITSKRAALPEVVGDAGLLFNPEQEGELASVLSRVLSDPALADDLRRRSLARAGLYTPARTTGRALALLRDVNDSASGAARSPARTP